MFSNLFFFYSASCSHDDIKFHLEKFHKPFKIITNRTGLQEYLINCGEDVEMIDEAIPNFGPIGEEVYEDSKKILINYDSFFQKISFKGISIYEGFQYKLLGMLVMFTKMIKILEQKKNVVFIFEGFYPIYFIIEQQIQEKKIYKNFKIQQIKGKQIENIINDKKGFSQKKQNSFSFQRSQNFFKMSMTDKTKIEKFIQTTLFFKQIVRLIINKIIFKYFTSNENNEERILNRIDKKMKNAYKDLTSICAFFVTSSREDLHVASWYPIFDRFTSEGKKFQIFTSDFSTSMLLTKVNLPFINLFEEVNILTNSLKSSPLGYELQNKIEYEIKNNQKILGLEAVYGDLIQRTYRSIAITIILQHIFFRSNIKSVALGADGEMLENIASAVAKKNKIPSYSMLSVELDPVFPWFADWFHADKIFLSGSHSKKLLKTLNYSDERLIVSGNPKFDKFPNIDIQESKKWLYEKFNVKQNKKLIIIGMARWHDNDDIWMSDFIKFCNKHDFEIIIKIHPKYKSTGSTEISFSKIEKIRKMCAGEKFIISYDIDLYRLLSAANLFITEYSMSGVEAIIFDKPVISVDFSNEEYTDSPIQVAINENAIIKINNYKDLENKILEIFENQDINLKLKEGREKIINQYNFSNDGNASKRIYDILMNS